MRRPISRTSAVKQASHFNKVAAGYDHLIDKRQVEIDTLLLRSCANIQDGDWVLDMGTGTGKIALSLIEEFANLHVVGVDLSRNMLTIARSKSKKAKKRLAIECYITNFLKLPFRDCVFDTVIVTYALHHVPKALRLNALFEGRRVLRSKGNLAIFEVGKKHYEEALKAYFRSDTVAQSRLSIQHLESLMAEAHFALRYSVDRKEFHELSVQHIAEYLKVQGITTKGDVYSSLKNELSDPQRITIERLLAVGAKT